MTPAQFRAAVARTRMSLDARAVSGALFVLVDGATQASAAAQAGCSRQAVAKVVKKLLRAARYCPTCGRTLNRWPSPQ